MDKYLVIFIISALVIAIALIEVSGQDRPIKVVCPRKKRQLGGGWLYGCINDAGSWSAWSPWSSCSRTCEIGVRRRTRTCSGMKCLGLSLQTQSCNTHGCKVCGGCQTRTPTNQQACYRNKKVKYVCGQTCGIVADACQSIPKFCYKMSGSEAYCCSGFTLKERNRCVC